MQRNNQKWNRMLTFLALGLMFTTAHSGTPLWKFDPQTSPSITITKGDSKQVRYTVRNQSNKPKILLMKPIAGVSQSTPCKLPAKGSCTLTLNVNGSALHGNVLGGPVLCQRGNGLQCYQPSRVNSLNITLTDAPILDTPILSVPLTGTIPVNAGFSSFTVTNNGSAPAYNVRATLPISWLGVTQDASNCAMIPPASDAPNNTCTLHFSAITPYIAQGGIPVTGDNITSPPTTALAFTVGGYLVWSVDSSNSVSVIDTGNLPEIQWGNNVQTNANSPTDGLTNTGIISGTVGIEPSAAVSCYNSTAGGAVKGDWYLPAICQMGGAGQGASCPAGLANIYTNLAQLGFGDFSPILFFWSSTESTTDPTFTAWIEGFTTDFQNGGFFKTSNSFAVRCSRTLTF